MQPLDLLRTAETLARLPSASQSDLNRAVSTAYYAVFHALCRTCADCIAGTDGHSSSSAAWQQIYRDLDHGFTSKQFNHSSKMAEFTQEIREFAKRFIRLQRLRQKADYIPSFHIARKHALAAIASARKAINALHSAPEKDRHAFAIWASHRHRA